MNVFQLWVEEAEVDTKSLKVFCNFLIDIGLNLSKLSNKRTGLIASESAAFIKLLWKMRAALDAMDSKASS